MEAIGGYFSLELPQREEHHKHAIRLNTGRDCLEYILRSREYKKVYIPYYTCEVILEPFKKTGTEYEYYHINYDFELVSDVCIGKDEALLYTNYYGLKQRYVEYLVERYGQQLIIDNTQAFYAKPVEGIDTFYTCRKFLGVPDGAYLYTDHLLDVELEQDQSYERMDSLTKRIDLSPEAAYADFRAQSNQLKNNPIRTMSRLTRRLMASIDHDEVARRRVANYRQLHAALGEKNGIYLPLANDAVPMVYPFLTDDDTLRKRLIDNKIYVAQYWPNVLDWCNEGCTDYSLTQHLLPIPIDQRYDAADMERIIQLI
jgi:hypothetical protein